MLFSTQRVAYSAQGSFSNLYVSHGSALEIFLLGMWSASFFFAVSYYSLAAYGLLVVSLWGMSFAPSFSES
jgi:hypothetical protein